KASAPPSAVSICRHVHLCKVGEEHVVVAATCCRKCKNHQYVYVALFVIVVVDRDVACFILSKAREYNNLRRLDMGQLRAFYERAKRRLFVLDYDGTLSDNKVLLRYIPSFGGQCVHCV